MIELKPGSAQELSYIDIEVQKSRKRLLIFSVVLVIFVIVAWQQDLSRFFERERLQSQAAAFGHVQGFFFFMAVFVAGEMTMVIPGLPPLLATLAAYLYGSFGGAVIGVAGSILVAMITYGTVKTLGADPRILGTLKPESRLARALQSVQERPIFTVAAIRIVPVVGQYPLTNAALALAGVGWRDYTLGTCFNLFIFSALALLDDALFRIAQGESTGIEGNLLEGLLASDAETGRLSPLAELVVTAVLLAGYFVSLCWVHRLKL